VGQRGNIKDLESYLEEAITNIRDDRAVTFNLLKEIMALIADDKTQHERIGAVAAKYVETLQRSNEQLVKISALIQKNEKGIEGLSARDKDEIFDIIKGQEDVTESTTGE